MKILIITHNIHPQISPRSFRGTELAKELARLGHDVTVYANLGDYDYSSFQEEYRLRVKNIGKMIFVGENSDGNYNVTLISRIISRLFKKVFTLPMLEFVWKTKGILRKEKSIDLLITIAVPHQIHWGAALAKSLGKEFAAVWVADCGDPFMGNKVHAPLFYFKYIEKWFMKRADFVTIPIPKAIKGYYQEFHDKIRVIPQGFNFNDINVEGNYIGNKQVTFVYAGTFYKGLRDPSLFLNYLSKLRVNFKFIIYTKAVSFLEPFKGLLGDKMEVYDYIPREKLIPVMSKADFLINFENLTQIQSPSKLIDYALSKRPILTISNIALDSVVIEEFFQENYDKQLIINEVDDYDIINVANKFLSLTL